MSPLFFYVRTSEVNSRAHMRVFYLLVYFSPHSRLIALSPIANSPSGRPIAKRQISRHNQQIIILRKKYICQYFEPLVKQENLS
jgi:hypothetical protein